MGTTPIAAPSRRAKLGAARATLPTDMSPEGIAAFAASEGVTVAAIKARVKRNTGDTPAPARPTPPSRPNHASAPSGAGVILARLSASPESASPAVVPTAPLVQKRPGRRPKSVAPAVAVDVLVQPEAAAPAKRAARAPKQPATRPTPVVSAKEAIHMLKDPEAQLSIVITDLRSGTVMLVSSGPDAA